MKAKKKMSMYKKGGMMYGEKGTKVETAAERLASYKEQLKKGGLTRESRAQLERSIKSLERQGVGLPKGTKLLAEVPVKPKPESKYSEEGLRYRTSNQAKQDYIKAVAKDKDASPKMPLSVAQQMSRLGSFNEWVQEESKKRFPKK
jgi:hypothetical protein